jgi:dihydrolipoamide dehydrogenase
MSKVYDVAVIGGGPGGYVAAVRLAQLGKNVAIIEAQSTLGGTCLNWGCIPSKALLDSSEHYYQITNKSDIHGINVKGVTLNLKQMMKRKQDVVDNTTQGISYLMEKNKIHVIHGHATFKAPTTVDVVHQKQTTSVTANQFIIATGSSVTPLPCVPTNGTSIITSNEAISLKKVPKHLIVIGGGVIGVELGSVYARLGAKVSIVEYMDRLLPGMDSELGKALKRSLSSHHDVSFYFKTKVTGVAKSGKTVVLQAEDASGKLVEIEGDVVLVSIGRRPNTEGLGLDNVGISLNDHGQIPIDNQFQTACPGIYAIGDVVPGTMLAHKASEEGVVCAEVIAGKTGHINYNAIPNVVYTWPEVASVGKTEDELKAKGMTYKSGKFPFKASGRARAAEETEGFIKVLADETTDEVLGVHMIGPRVADVIAEAVMAMEYRASAEDLGMMINPHPTFSEALKEASLAATGNRAIHF